MLAGRCLFWGHWLVIGAFSFLVQFLGRFVGLVPRVFFLDFSSLRFYFFFCQFFVTAALAQPLSPRLCSFSGSPHFDARWRFPILRSHSDSDSNSDCDFVLIWRLLILIDILAS